MGKHVFPHEDLKIEIAMTSLGGFPRISASRVCIATAPDRVQIVPLELTDDALRRTEGTATTLLKLLPHTPIAAVGVNFAFEESEPSEALKGRFVDPDRNALIESGFIVEAHSWVKHLKLDDGFAVNLNVWWDAQSVRFAINFHRDVDDAEAAKDALEGRVLACRDSAYRVLSQVYGLTKEEADGQP